MARGKAAIIGSEGTLHGISVIPVGVSPLLSHLSSHSGRKIFQITLNDNLRACVNFRIRVQSKCPVPRSHM